MAWTPEQARAYNAAQTPEQALVNGTKGGKASGEARRRKQSMREGLQLLLACTEPNPDARAKLEALGLEPTIQNAILNAVNERARDKGDPEAARFVRDTVGDAPAQVHDVRVDASLDLRELTTEELQRLVAEAESD